MQQPMRMGVCEQQQTHRPKNGVSKGGEERRVVTHKEYHQAMCAAPAAGSSEMRILYVCMEGDVDPHMAPQNENGVTAYGIDQLPARCARCGFASRRSSNRRSSPSYATSKLLLLLARWLQERGKWAPALWGAAAAATGCRPPRRAAADGGELSVAA